MTSTNYLITLIEPSDTHSVHLSHNPVLEQFSCRGCVLSDSIHEANEYFDDLSGVIIHLLRHEIIGECFPANTVGDLLRRFSPSTFDNA